jgi:uncharacterized repeat protein (TIGR02543 family)
MPKIQKKIIIPSLALLVLSLTFAAVAIVRAAGEPVPDAGAAYNYAVITEGGFSMGAGGTVSGDITGASASTPGTHTNGSVRVPLNAAAQSAKLSVIAEMDTYNLAAGNCTFYQAAAADLTLLNPGTGTPGLYTPGVYCIDGAITQTGNITLSGSGAYIFKFGAAFANAANAQMILTNGASPGSIFLRIEGAAAFGAGANVSGTFIAKGATTSGANLTVNGRLWGFTAAGTVAVTTGATITVPPPAGYTVTFNGNGSNGGTAMDPQLMAPSPPASVTNLNANTYARSGYTFANWNTAANGSGTSYANNFAYSNSISANITLYARWTANTNTLTFNGNGFTGGSTAAQFINTGDTATLNTNGFTRTGYTFTGWNTLANGTGTPYANPASYTMGTSNATLFAQWTANANTLTFNGNGFTGGSTANQTINSDATPANLNANGYTRTGYTFAGWNTLANGTGTGYVNNATNYTMGTSNATLFAIWTINSYTLSFNSNGGTAVTAITQNYNTAISSPTAPTKTGYTFAGWSPTVPGTMPASNTAVAAQWTINSYTLSFNSNGGTAVTAITQDYNTAISSPTAPTKTGYTFAGWSPTVPGTMPASNTTVAAQWTANANTLTFNGNGFTGGSTANQTINSDATPANLNANGYTRTGYTFAGWNTLAIGTGTGYVNNATNYTMGTSNATLFAQWTANANTLTFNGNGFTSGSTANQTINSDATPANLNANGYTRTGYTFAGWNTLANGTGTGYVNNATNYTMGTSNATLFAIWTINSYTLSFNSNGGTAVTAITQNYNTAISSPTAPTKTGYTFAGWSPTVPGTMPASNTAVAAQWTANPNTLTFNGNGFDGGSTANQTINSDATPANLNANGYTLTGYTFAGWNTAANGSGTGYANNATNYTMGTSNATLFARWTADTRTLTFNGNGFDGGATAAQSIAPNTSVSLTPNGFTRIGYTFAGWNTLANGTGTSYVNLASYPMGTSNATLFAIWTINSYTLSFNSNGGTAVTAITQNYNTAISSPTAPTKTGYTFAGWSPTVPGTMPASNTAVAAQWTANPNTLTFNGNGFDGGSTAAQTINSGTTATLNANGFTRTGYAFIGWTADIGGVGQLYVDGDTDYTMGTSDFTLYAKWVINSYTLSFNSNGGTAVTSITQDYGTAISSPTAPTKTGYTFAGWSPTVPGTMPAGNTAVAALWTANTNTLTFNGNGFTSGSTANQTINSDATANLNANGFTRTGYTFAGWNTLANGSGTPYANLASYPMGTSSATLFARWTANPNTITFNGNGFDGGSTAAQSINTDASANLTSNGFTRTGYTFNGWNTLANGTGSSYTNGQYYSMGTSDIVLFARWATEVFTLSFNSNGGTAVTAIVQSYGTAISSPTAPTKTGYTFAGWSPTVPGTMPASNTTVAAQWTINSYTLSFNSNGGTAVTSITQDYGTAISSPTAPTKTGYTFAGWSPTVPGTMPAGNTAVAALWTANTNTLTFNGNGFDGGSTAAQSITTGASANLAANGFTRAGYTFVGWNTLANGSGTSYAAGTNYVMGTSDKTLYARWTLETKTLTFNGNSSNGGSTAAQEIELNTSVPLTANGFTKTGYVFSSWNTLADGTGTSYVNLASYPMGTSNATLFARWTANTNTLSFNGNGSNGGSTATQSIDTDASANLTNNGFVRTGYTFNGWNTAANGTGTSYANGANYAMSTSNKTLFAQWVVNTYTLAFNSDGGSAIAAMTQNYGTSITPPAAPTKAGYRFNGWSPGIPVTMSSSNQIVTAQWVVNTPQAITAANDLTTVRVIAAIPPAPSIVTPVTATPPVAAPRTANVYQPPLIDHPAVASSSEAVVQTVADAVTLPTILTTAGVAMTTGGLVLLWTLVPTVPLLLRKR